MKSGLSTKLLSAAALVVCLALAGFVSYYASGSPDGLNKVAADHGFDSAEKESAAADSPLSGYTADGVDDPRLSGAVAGAVGVVVVLVVAGGLAFAVRRKHHQPDQG